MRRYVHAREGQESDESSFSPGLWVGGGFLVVVYALTGHLTQWWAWLVGILIVIVVDLFTGVEAREVPKEKTTTKYTRTRRQ